MLFIFLTTILLLPLAAPNPMRAYTPLTLSVPHPLPDPYPVPDTDLLLYFNTLGPLLPPSKLKEYWHFHCLRNSVADLGDKVNREGNARIHGQYVRSTTWYIGRAADTCSVESNLQTRGLGWNDTVSSPLSH